KGLTLFNSSPVHLGSRGFSLNRGGGGLGKGGHEHNKNLPRRHAAAEAAEATAPETTEAATTAARRIPRRHARYASRIPLHRLSTLFGRQTGKSVQSSRPPKLVDVLASRPMC